MPQQKTGCDTAAPGMTAETAGGNPAPAIRRASIRRRAAALLALAAFLGSASGRAAEAEINEFTIKAAYISKFGGFIRWPDGAFSSDTSPITICVVGDNPVGAALAKGVIRPVGSRPVTLKTIKAFSKDAGCHILFAGDPDAERVAKTLKAARGAGVLTVTDLTESAISEGSGADPVINFVIKDNRIKFEIDEQAAADNGLTISSQLLGLAVSVKTRG